MSRWHIVTGEYPPQPGGVSDYTRLLARGLAAAGDEVHVWAPATAGSTPAEGGVAIHRLPGHFGPRALAALDAGLKRFPPTSRLLVQYVPHAFGWKAMNLPFCLWLAQRRRERVWVMFHEVAFPVERSQPWKHKVLGWVTRWMASLVAGSAERIFISIPGWEPLLRKLSPACPSVTWLPVPSNLAATPSAEETARIRRELVADPAGLVVGHFSTFSHLQASLLAGVLPPVLQGDRRRIGLLLGRGGDRFARQLEREHPPLRSRLVAPGELDERTLVNYLASCDVLVQTYPDGASTRRTSLMAGLALGLPIVTTLGPLSEPLWQESGAVVLAPVESAEAITAATESLLADDQRRAQLAQRARAFYHERFGTDRLIQTLRAAL
jgi:glycosyltransferase involved in cell wall biosynthesis